MPPTSVSAYCPELRYVTATLAPSAARASAISRPTPLVAPVTKATLPFIPRSMVVLSRFGPRPRRLDQAEQAFRRYGKLIHLNSERRQCVGNRVGDCRRRTDGAALTHPTKTTK